MKLEGGDRDKHSKSDPLPRRQRYRRFGGNRSQDALLPGGRRFPGSRHHGHWALAKSVTTASTRSRTVPRTVGQQLAAGENALARCLAWIEKVERREQRFS